MYKEDLCYLPTRRMCDMNEKLDKSFFDIADQAEHWFIFQRNYKKFKTKDDS